MRRAIVHFMKTYTSDGVCVFALMWRFVHASCEMWSECDAHGEEVLAVTVP